MLLLINGTHLGGLQILYSKLPFKTKACIRDEFVSVGLVHEEATRFRRESEASLAGADAFDAKDTVDLRGSLSTELFDELWMSTTLDSDGGTEVSLAQRIELLVVVVLKVFGDSSHHKNALHQS